MNIFARFGAVVTVGVLGLVMTSVGVASADDADTAQAPIYHNEFVYCTIGSVPSATTEGFVNYQHVGNTLHVEVHFKNAVPNTTYSVILSSGCADLAVLGAITTNSNGVGNGHFDVSVPPGTTNFFVWGFSTTGQEWGTPGVNLP